ncbi:TnsD family Tn7-like transposition protein [Herbaspirillum robiniae]|nr:TnsD family Tn7-like transposition protein [Herbaspirillum robiniae]
MEVSGHIQYPLPFTDEFGVRTWFPDETVYSLVSRIHVLSGENATTTCRRLFGHHTQGSQHDLPSWVDHFVSSTFGMFGDSNEILRHHSIAPYFLFLRSEAEQDSVLRGLSSGGIGGLKYRLGLISGRFRAHHPLRICPVCAAADRESFFVAYWHVCHQLPGTLCCPYHGNVLADADIKANGVGRFLWYLPDQIPSYCLPLLAYPDGHLHLLLQRIAQINLGISKFDGGLVPENIAALYRNRIKEKFGENEKVSRLNCVAEFREYLQPLSKLETFLYVDHEKAAASIFGRVFGGRGHIHPLNHALFISFLYGSWEEFERLALASDLPPAFCDGQFCVNADTLQLDFEHSRPERREEIGKLLLDDKLSCRAAAARLGVDVGTIQAWAAQIGIEVGRRPKTVFPEVREKIVAGLRQGLDKALVAADCGVSIQVVTRTLRTSPHLHSQWMAEKYRRIEEKNKEQWCRLSLESPGLSTSELRAIQPSVYAWLYRNDPEWLSDQCRNLPKQGRAPNAGVEWHRRDAELASTILHTILVLYEEDRSRKFVSIGDICRRQPSIRPMLAQLERLPLTRRALKQLSQRAIGINLPDLFSGEVN